MRLKGRISLLLVFLFIGKLFVVDANAVEVYFQGDLSFTKPMCSKKHSVKKSNGITHMHSHVNSEDFKNLVSGTCNPYYAFNEMRWQLVISKELRSRDKISASRLSDRYLESKSPPPKFG